MAENCLGTNYENLLTQKSFSSYYYTSRGSKDDHILVQPHLKTANASSHCSSYAQQTPQDTVQSPLTHIRAIGKNENRNSPSSGCMG